MQMTVKCSACDVVIAIVEKDEINDSDIQMYQQNVTCADDGAAAICELKSE